MRIRLLFFLLIAIIAVGGYRCLLPVDETEMVIVTEFGRPVPAYRLASLRFSREKPWILGVWEVGQPRQSGLHFKLPWQSAIRVDRRLQIYDPPPFELLAAGEKSIELELFVCWRVDDPRRFLETVGDRPGAEARLRDILWSQLAAAIESRPLEAIVSTNSATGELEEIQKAVARACAESARISFGIELVDVRVKRIGVPAEVREGVLERMRAEWGRIARHCRAEGEKEARMIRAEADKQKAVKLAKAEAEAERIRGKAEAEAARVYAEAHRVDPEFYQLMRTLEAYRRFLDEKTTVLLSADSELLKFLSGPPAAAGEAKTPE